MNPKPKLPRGYRWLKVGDKKAKGYKFWNGSGWTLGQESASTVLSSGRLRVCGPYIAPIIKRPAQGAKVLRANIMWASNDYKDEASVSFVKNSAHRKCNLTRAYYKKPVVVICPPTLTEARALVKKFNGRAKK